MRYFNNVENLEQLRKQYKELLKKFHPDNENGSVEITQEINAEYDKLFKLLKDRHEQKQTDTSSSKTDFNKQQYNYESDILLREMLQKVIILADISIEICGSWIWISGNTYKHKTFLKEIGFKWASQKKQWFYHVEPFRKKSNKPLSMDDIRSYYGSTEVYTATQRLLKQA